MSEPLKVRGGPTRNISHSEPSGLGFRGVRRLAKLPARKERFDVVSVKGATAEDPAPTADAPPAAADLVPSGSESFPIVIGPPLVFGVVRDEELADLSSLIRSFNPGSATEGSWQDDEVECQHARSIRHRSRKIVAWPNGASTPESASVSATVPTRLRGTAAI
jgi:hypothetical protein